MNRLWQTIAALALSMGMTPAALAANQPGPYEAGVAARLAGEHERAVELLQTTVALEPANADAHLQLGLALMAAERLDAAELSLRRTLEIAPTYQDAIDALARLARLRAAAAKANYRWQIDVDGAFSALGRSQPGWYDGVIQARRRLEGGISVAAAIELSRRFGVTDVYGELRVDQRLRGRANIWASLGGTPNADFRPEWQIAAGGSLPVSSGSHSTVLTAEGRYAQYVDSDVRALTAGIEQYVGGGSWLTGRIITVVEDGDYHAGWLARGDLMASRRLRLFIGAADAPDLSEGAVTRVFSVFGGAAADVSDQAAVRFSMARENREGAANRIQVALGMAVRF